MKADPNKEKALAAVLSQIEKQFGKGSIMKLGDSQALVIESISNIKYSYTLHLIPGNINSILQL